MNFGGRQVQERISRRKYRGPFYLDLHKEALLTVVHDTGAERAGMVVHRIPIAALTPHGVTPPSQI